MTTLEQLKKAIQTEVFVTKDQQKIVSKNGFESQWLFDFRSILLQPQYLNLVADIFWERYKNKYPFQVGGQEVASIPLIAAVVMKSVEKGMPVNGFFIRKSRKKDGLMKMVEGKVTDDKIILIDDILNSGNTILRQLAVADELKKRVTDVFAILVFRKPETYGFLKERGVTMFSFFTLPDFNIDFRENKEQQNVDIFKVEWKFKSEGANFHYVVPKSAPAIDTDKVYFGSDSGHFWALNQKDGSVAWKYKVGWHAKGKSIFSSPIIYNDTVFFGSYDGNLYALDAKTGKKKWLFMEADWIGSSPDISPELKLLFVGLEFGLIKKRGGIAALHIETGEKVWEYILPELTHSSPLYIPSRKEVIIGSNNGAVYLFNAKNGKLLWTFKTNGEVKESFAYDEKRKLVLFGSFDGKLYALDVKDGLVAFTYETKAGIYSTSLVSENSVYIASLDKRLYKINLDSGEMEWMFATSGRIFASPLGIDGYIYIGSNDGRFYKIDSKTGKAVGILQVTERVTNKVAYNSETKRIFLPTFANEIYCLKER